MSSILNEIVSASIDIAKDYFKQNLNKIIEKKWIVEDKNELSLDEIKKIESRFRKYAPKVSICVNADDSLLKIQSHIDNIKHWCADINFKSSGGRRRLQDVYISLDTFLVPLSKQICPEERHSKKTLESVVFDSSGHLLILGGPGAGKTTAVKKFLHLFTHENSPQFKKHGFPILIRLREVDINNYVSAVSTIDGNAKRVYDDIIVQEISNLFDFKFQEKPPTDLEKHFSVFFRELNKHRCEAFLSYLDKLAPIIFLDGFDEVPNHDAKRSMLKEICSIAKKMNHSRIIVTCRTGEVSWPSEDFQEFEIAPLSWPQIESFAARWIQPPKSSQSFIKEVKKSPFADTAMKPLSLAHLCAIYERIERIPDKPKAVYRRVVRLLLEEWDEQREVKRISKYSNFDVDRKYEFLSDLAYYFSVDRQKYIMTENDLRVAYKKLRNKYRLAEEEETAVVNELESHTGLFIQGGADQYEFSHKSLQEYMAAEHLVKLPNPPRGRDVIGSLSSELAIAVSISSNSTMYLDSIILNCFNYGSFSTEYYFAFISRMLLEKPDFEHSEESHFLLLTLFSLWFCGGQIPSRESVEKYAVPLSKNVEKFDIMKWPAITDSFDRRSWNRFSKQLLAKGRSSKIGKTGLVSIYAMKPIGRLQNDIKHLVFPEDILGISA